VLPVDKTVALTVLVGASAPPAVSVMMFPARYGYDEKYAAELFSVSTLIGIVSIPLMCFLYDWFSRLIAPLLPY
jgi:predicted permease